LHLPIQSADDLKYSLTFIHQFRLQWTGMGDSSFVSAGEALQACEDRPPKGYKPLAAYGQSKIADLLFAKELQRRFAGTKKTAYAVHPGVVDTGPAEGPGDA
jgi:NAD(P)-dependent dehydrogenase (short-subunit alcohol dehydrogenase family)